MGKHFFPCGVFYFQGKPSAAANFLGFPLVFLSILLMLTGCATTLPRDVRRTPSTAFANYDTTSPGKFFEEAALQHPGKSRFVQMLGIEDQLQAAVDPLSPIMGEIMIWLGRSDRAGRLHTPGQRILQIDSHLIPPCKRPQRSPHTRC